MPVALPAPNHLQPQPHLPEDPPDDFDVAAAVLYKQRLVNGKLAADDVTDTHLNDAAVYESSIVQARGGDQVAPPWFAAAVQQAVAQAIEPLRDDISAFTNQTNILHNSRCTISTMEFKIVSFERVAGGGRVYYTKPTVDPYNLPALKTLADIRNLSHPQSLAYFRGYYPTHGLPSPAPEERKAMIRIAIGAPPL